jgi:hypothetical protein
MPRMDHRMNFAAAASAAILGALVYAGAAPAQPANGPSATKQIPDLSGIWTKNRGRLGAVKNMSPYPDMVMGDYTDPILKPWVAAVIKKRAEMEKEGNPPPEAKMTCWPDAPPNTLAVIGGEEILQTPKTVFLLTGNDHQWRTVPLDQAHSANPKPSWYGESVGHYDGDTLVVDTIGVNTEPMSMIDDFGTPHTAALHVIERYHLVSGGKTMNVDIIVDDPGAFTKKWEVTATFNRSPNPMNESVCSANNRLDMYGPSIGKMPEAKYISPF